MIIKKLDKKGQKYYVNAFTGRRVEIKFSDPLKREANPLLARLMSERISLEATQDKKAKKTLCQRSAFVGDYKRIMRLNPEIRDKKEFIKVCKRVNVNPWPLMSVCAIKN